MNTPRDDGRSGLERALGLITEVKAGEGVTALLLSVNIFLLLLAYYLIKPVREALILELEDGDLYKSYMNGGIAAALLLAVPAYSAFAKKVARNRLVISVTLFFAMNLVAFYLLSFTAAGTLAMGLGFYLWVGIFNMMVIAQAWAFAADLYTDAQGKRLFALVGVGASLGAFAGSVFGSQLNEAIGVFRTLLVAAAILAALAAIVQIIHVRESTREVDPTEPDDSDRRTSAATERDADADRGAFGIVFKHRYLAYLAVFSVIFTFVNSNGEFLLSNLVSSWAEEQQAAGALPDGMELRDFIGVFYGNFYMWVNSLGVFIQTFVVSRLVKHSGIKVAFLVLPFIAVLNAGLLIALPVLTALRWGKVAENAVDYSVNNTVRNMLWLPTTREMKYRAKQAVDTFFVRMGDVSSAVLVLLFAGTLHLDIRWFGAVNAVVAVLWIALALRIIKERQRLIDARVESGRPPPQDGGA